VSSSTNKFVPCLQEFVGYETSKMREVISVQLNSEIKDSMKKSKEYMDISLVQVQQKAAEYVNSCLNEKLESIEQTNVLLSFFLVDVY